jgi:membrane fusion protein (multidrug efflux system)
MKTRTKYWLAAVLGLLLVIGALVGIKAAQIGTMIKAGESFTPPPESVSSATVERSQWQATRSAVGTLVAVQGATLGSELSGLVREVSYDSGADVKQGQVLVRLDSSTEEAQLAAAQADAALARANLDRARILRKNGSNAPADLDAAEARAKQAEAAVATLRTTIAKKTIRAPFAGRVAIRQVELGQVISPGAPVASLLSVTPIHVDFWLPQQALADVKRGQRVRVRTDTFPDATWEGEITAVNPQVDVATRNVLVRATVANADGRLRPGMFATVEAVSPETRDVLIVPATAVMFAPYGDSVFVIEEKKDGAGKAAATVRQKFVRTGERRGDFIVVESGLEAGARIVSSGAFKLRNGMAVVVNDALAPKPELSPRPAEP